MKKLLKAQDIKTLFIVDDTAYPKETFEQMILAAKRSANWGASTDADLTITHCDTIDGQFVAFDVINVIPPVSGVAQVEVNLVAMKDYFKISIEEDGGNDIVDVVAILADDRLIAEAVSAELPVNVTPRSTLSLDAFEI